MAFQCFYDDPYPGFPASALKKPGVFHRRLEDFQLQEAAVLLEVSGRSLPADLQKDLSAFRRWLKGLGT